MATKQILFLVFTLSSTIFIVFCWAMEQEFIFRKFDRRGNFKGNFWSMIHNRSYSSQTKKLNELSVEIDKLNPDPYDTEGYYKAIDTIEQRCKLDSRGKGCAGLLAVYTELLDISTKKTEILDEIRDRCLLTPEDKGCVELSLIYEKIKNIADEIPRTSTNNALSIEKKNREKKKFSPNKIFLDLDRGVNISECLFAYDSLNNLSPQFKYTRIIFLNKKYQDIEKFEFDKKSAGDYSQCFTDTDKLHKYANNHHGIFCSNVILQLNRNGELENIGTIVWNTQNQKYCDLAKEHLRMQETIDRANAKVSEYQ